MDTAATELECFQELQKQEQMAASYRVRNLTEEVNKQKALERTLQSCYGDLLSGYQTIQEQLEEHKRQLKIQEAVEAENRAREEEIAAQNRAAEEENERKNCSVEEEIGQMNGATDEEAAGSKEINEDQMDVDNRNEDGEFVGPIPPAPDTQGDNNEASVQQNTSNAQSGDNATPNDGACDKIDSSKLGGQDNTDGSMAVNASSQEEGKNELATVGTSMNEGNTDVSSNQDVSKEENGSP